MSIRSKFLALFLLTLLVLSGLSLYAAAVYRAALTAEHEVETRIYAHIDMAHLAQQEFNRQLNAWKNVLLRGNETDSYHNYLQIFYAAERSARKRIGELRDHLAEVPTIRARVQDLVDAHYQAGLEFRAAIRIYNNTDVNAGTITDNHVAGVELGLLQLFPDISQRLHEHLERALREVGERRATQERVLLGAIVFAVLIALALYLWLVDRNVTRPAERATYLAELVENAQRFARFGTWDWDSGKDRHYWSDGLFDILGIDRGQEASRALFIQSLHEDDRERVGLALDEALDKRQAFELEARFRLPGGEERVVQQRGQVTAGDAGKNLRMTSIVYDITERKESERRLAYLANYDTLTGLPNRNLFQDRLKHALAQADRHDKQVALLFLDLDHFKAVNDALGHNAGDQLLIEVTRRISRTLRAGDTLARLGGDEFTIVIEQVDSSEQVVTIAEHVLGTLTEPYHIESNELFVSGSIGITFYPGDGDDVETLLKNADSAMYLAKEQGRNGYHFYTDELNERAQQKLAMENGLRSALQRQEFELHYQPKVDLGSGRVLGAEALLRWAPGGDFVSPARFIPVLEETGMISAVGKWVLEQACATAVQWKAAGYRDLCIAVNLAVQQLRQPNIVELIAEVLENSGLPAELLEIEVTESTLIDTSISERNLRRLEGLGVSIAIDDFGTGYSSLSYLKQYSVDVLKIDRSFIKDITVDRDDDAVTEAIVALSHKLDMDVTAEGIETLGQLEFLRKVRCDQAQGYLIARPMDKARFDTWLADLSDGVHPIWHIGDDRQAMNAHDPGG